MNNASGLLTLCDELLLQIFDYFSDDTAVMRKILAPVCKKFYNLANDTSICRKVQFYGQHNEKCKNATERFGKFFAFLLSLHERDPSSKLLSNINTMVINLNQPLMFHACPFAQITTTFINVNIDGSLQVMRPVWFYICQYLHRLQTVSISLADFNVSFLTTLPPSLAHLHLERVRLPQHFFQPLQDERLLPNLKCLHLLFLLDEPWLQLLVSRAPKLESLSMATSGWSGFILPVLRNAPHLKSLSIVVGLATVYAEDLLQVIASTCRNLEYLKFSDFPLGPSCYTLFHYHLTKLKQLSFKANCHSAKVEDIWSLCENVGHSVKVKVYLRSLDPKSRELHQDWTSRNKQCDNLDIVLCEDKHDVESLLSVACIPQSSTEPCSKLYGRKRPSITKLCCPCNDCKRVSQYLKREFPASFTPDLVPNKQIRIE